MRTLGRHVVRLLVLCLATALLTAAPAAATAGIGGSTAFTPRSVFPFIAGTDSSIDTSFTVQNIGDEDAIVEVSSTKIPGIAVSLLGSAAVNLRPGEARQLPIRVSVSRAVAIGRYDILISAKQTNVKQIEAGITYAPSITGALTIQIFGASATVRLRALNLNDGGAISGQLDLYYLDEEDRSLLLESTNQSVLTRSVVPGRYRAIFSIPGLTQTRQEFSVKSGEFKDVALRVAGIEFRLTAARPIRNSDGVIVSAELIASVRNNLRRFEQPMVLKVQVLRDGKDYETIKLAQLPELPEGTSEQRNQYTPADGFGPGIWSFEFELETKGFTVSATNTPSFRGNPLLSLRNLQIGGALGVLLAGFFFIVWRRRRRKDEQDGPESDR